MRDNTEFREAEPRTVYVTDPLTWARSLYNHNLLGKTGERGISGGDPGSQLLQDVLIT